MKLNKILLLLAATMTLGSCSALSAETFTGKLADFASASLAPAIVVTGISLMGDGPQGKEQAQRGAKALLVTALVVEGLKNATDVTRPNGGTDDSFPSGHTAEAFALATVIADYNPKVKTIAYAGAALVGWSRVENDDHYWKDVLAGAVIGHVIAKQYTKGNFGVTPEGTLGYHSSF